MVNISHTTSNNKDFFLLIEQLDAELWRRYPELQSEYEQHVKLDYIETVLIVYENDHPVGCGCFVERKKDLAEIRRMFVQKEYRGKGISKIILNELEKWAKSLGYKTTILETGIKQPEAISLYKNSGYKITERYEPFKDLQDSFCFRKDL